MRDRVPATTADQLGPTRAKSSRATAIASAALLAVGVSLSLLGLVQADPRGIGPLGLIEALPLTYEVGVAAICLSSGLSLMGDTAKHTAITCSCALGLAVLLQMAPVLVEPLPRFNTAWLHVGFSDYIAESGRTAPLLDARFSWPAFFGLSAALQDGLSLGSAVAFLRYWPVVFNVLYLPGIFRLALLLSGQRRVALVALLIFPMINWVGQDYYSPQSVAFLLLLGFLLTCLHFFGGTRLQVLRGAGRVARDPATSSLAAFLLVLTLFLALTVEHQLTPVAALLCLAGLAVVGRTQLWLAPIWMFLVLAAWVSFGAAPYWTGHLHELLGGVGHVTGNVSTGVGGRLGGSSQHGFIVRVRLGFALAAWGLAAAGVLRLRGPGRAAAVALLLAPFAVLAVQSYGGEGALRIYLFTLPVVSTAIAHLVVGLHKRPLSAALSTVVLLAAFPAFLLSRWGNELYEQTRPTELAAVNQLMLLAPKGSTLVSISPQLPWRFSRANDYRYEPANLSEFALRDLPALRSKVAFNPVGAYVIITTSQVLYGEQAYGLPRNWNAAVEHDMLGSREYREIYRNRDARIYQFVQTG